MFLEYAEMLGADKIATGHYVRHGVREGRPRLLKGLDGNKDQSYFLHAVPEAAIARTLFPWVSWKNLPCAPWRNSTI